jgi:hypothetical protein
MRATIELRYWWNGWSNNIEYYVQQCMFCQKRKAGRNGTVPIQEYLGPDHPFERAHMDLTGPLPKTAAGNQYIFVIKDALTRYVDTIPLQDKTAREVAAALVKHVYLQHGSIGTLISDKGTEFTNATMQGVAKILKTKRICTTPANPRSNGLAENHNRLMKDSLASFCNARHDDWDLWIDVVKFGYNTTVNSATGFTPFYMLYGREANNPSNDWINSIKSTVSREQYTTDLVDRLQWVWTTVSKQKKTQVKVMNDSLHPRTHLPAKEYKVGEYCFLKRVPSRHYIDWKDRAKYKISSKLQTRYIGPYLIIEKRSPVLYRTMIDGHGKMMHAINMKACPNVKEVSQTNLAVALKIDAEELFRRFLQLLPYKRKWNEEGLKKV